MIISHKHKFIFIKTKKTAGTSIEIALSAICGDDDILTPINPEDEQTRLKVANRAAQNYLIPSNKYTMKDRLRKLFKGKSAEFYNHMPASEVKRRVDENLWNSYFKFSFERHPVSKSISHYKWRGKKVGYSSYEEYLNSTDVNLIKGDHFYKDQNDKLLIDKI